MNADMSPLNGQKLIFLPGLDGTGISIEPLRKILPSEVKVQTIRYPAKERLNIDQTVQWAADQITPKEEVVVLAESFSGPVAVVLVASGRIRAKALILCATFARAPRPRLLGLRRYLPIATLLKLPWPISILKYFVKGGRHSAEVLLGLWKQIKPVVPIEILLHRLEVIHQLDVRPWLKRVKVPCLYLQATGDHTVPAGALSDFTSAIPHLKVARIDGPHFLLQAQPRRSLAAIEDFLQHLTDSMPQEVS
ncbi:MAG: alpha/beta hydrolase [Desulfobacteraceae bacterium]|nr:alpha/beta hydrolase [Desulfobacteraceae bacterium]